VEERIQKHRFFLVLLFSLLILPISKTYACTNPAGQVADIVYNPLHNVMQFCNGTDWVAMGVPNAGAGAGGCSDPVGTEGQLSFNTNHRVMQFCNGQNWVRVKGGSNKWIQITGQGDHTCAMRHDNTIWCAGSDNSGQLGDGIGGADHYDRTQESTLSTDWAQIDAGSFHTCAIKTDGTLWCWGSDNDGRLGNGATTGNQVSPVQEVTAANDWAQVSGGGWHTCAVKTDGTLYCWGDDDNGQLGNGATTGDQDTPVQEVTAANDWAQVSAGVSSRHTCAIKTNGTLWCWGDDTDGRLGNGAPTGDQISPVQESTLATDWAVVGAGRDFSCAIKTDGTLWCWGEDADEELGNGATSGDQVSPTQEGTLSTNWSKLATDYSHSCAIKTDGTLWCWGGDGWEALGDGIGASFTNVPTQEHTYATDWAEVALATNASCGIKTNGSLWCWGTDVNGTLGNGNVTADQESPVQEYTGAMDWVSVSSKNRTNCALKSDGTIYCWGDGDDGELGNGSTTGSAIAIQETTAATNWSQVSSGSNFSCAVKTDDTLWCWGYDGDGRLGEGPGTADQTSPAQESTLATDWAQVDASGGWSGAHACAVKTGGQLYCWGSDDNGQLGNGATAGDQQDPGQESTAATDWSQVSTGYYHTCAIKTDGSLFCWGVDDDGQLGNGATAGDQISPSQESTAATDWAQISAGSDHSCAIKTDGTLWCWGDDTDGELGNGATAGDQISPSQESTLATDWAQVSAGQNFTCAVKVDRSLWCWGNDGGNNWYGNLGNGPAITGDQISPSQEITAATDWVSVTAAGQHACAVKTDGTLWCWGDEYGGRLGILPIADIPVQNSECQDPVHPMGIILYNSANNIIQFCDGVGWAGVGK
jgi:alpha-tubulin suppressor-like RCC1 family protein